MRVTGFTRAVPLIAHAAHSLTESAPCMNFDPGSFQIDLGPWLQYQFIAGSVIMGMMGAFTFATKVKGGIPLVGGLAAAGAAYWLHSEGFF